MASPSGSPTLFAGRGPPFAGTMRHGVRASVSCSRHGQEAVLWAGWARQTMVESKRHTWQRLARNAGSATLTALGTLGLVTVGASAFIIWLLLSQPMSMMVAMSESESATWITVIRQLADEVWVVLKIFL